jgi:hypothetical protein
MIQTPALSQCRPDRRKAAQLAFDSAANRAALCAGRAQVDAEQRTSQSTQSVHLQSGCGQANITGSVWISSHRHPERHATLQSGISAKRHFSRIFPAHPRSLASALIPRPAARRCSASSLRTPFGSGFPKKNLPAALALAGGIFLRSLRRKHISALGVGRLASLRARVFRGQSGQIQTGEEQWHSTKTRSL